MIPSFIPGYVWGARPAGSELPIDMQLDAVRRYQERIDAANRPPTPLQAIAAEVADVVTTVVKKRITKTQAAMEWLRTVLEHGPVAQKDIERMAGEAKIGTKPLKMAKGRLKVRSVREGRGYWVWQMPFKKTTDVGGQ
jgi:hypothetical protein